MIHAHVTYRHSFTLALISASTTLASLASAQEPKLRHTLEGHGNTITSVAFSPNGKIVASSSDDGRIKLWEVETGKIKATLNEHMKQVKCVAFSPSGRLLASASWDTTVKLWEIATQKCIASYERDVRYVYCVAFSPDGKRLASGSFGGTVLLWEVSSGKEIAKFPSDGRGSMTPHSLAFSPDGIKLAAGGGRVREANFSSLKFWNISSGKETVTEESHYQYADSVVFSPDGKIVASAGGITGLAGGVGRADLYLWDAASGKKLFGLEKQAGVFAAFSPDGKTLATAGGWTPAKKEPFDFAVSIRNSQVGKQLAPGTILFLDVATRRPTTSFQGHVDTVRCAAYSPDGKILATGSQDKTIKLWDLQPAKAK